MPTQRAVHVPVPRPESTPASKPEPVLDAEKFRSMPWLSSFRPWRAPSSPPTAACSRTRSSGPASPSSSWCDAAPTFPKRRVRGGGLDRGVGLKNTQAKTAGGGARKRRG